MGTITGSVMAYVKVNDYDTRRVGVPAVLHLFRVTVVLAESRITLYMYTLPPSMSRAVY